MDIKIVRKGYDTAQTDAYVAKLKSNYESELSKQKALISMLKDKIVLLDGKLKEYESKKEQIAKVLIAAQQKADEMAAQSDARYSEEVKALRAFHLRWSSYYKRLVEKYPVDEELEAARRFSEKVDEIFADNTEDDRKALEQFRREQEKITGIPAQRKPAKEGEFDYNAALNPSEDLNTLLHDLGLGEDK